MATDSVPCPFRWVCLVPGLLQAFPAQRMCGALARRETSLFQLSLSDLDRRY